MSEDNPHFSNIDDLISHYGVSDSKPRERMTVGQLDLAMSLVHAITSIRSVSNEPPKSFMMILMTSISSLIVSSQLCVTQDRDQVMHRTDKVLDDLCEFMRSAAHSAIKSSTQEK